MSNKRPLTIKRQRFIKEIVANGGNATEAAMTVYKPKNRAVAGSMGTEILQSPQVRTEIMRLFEKNKMDLPFLLAHHKRNILQDKSYTASQSAIRDAYELLGLTATDKPNVNVAFVIEP